MGRLFRFIAIAECRVHDANLLPAKCVDAKVAVELTLLIHTNRSQRCPAVPQGDRLVGLMVKASASRAEDPGFESCLRRDFFGVESYQ